MSYLYYLCLFEYRGVQHILYWFFFFSLLCTICCQFLWIVHLFLLTLRFSLTFIYKQFVHAINQNIIQYEFLIAFWN